MLSGRLRHGGHPVLRWNVQNVTLEQDAAGNIKPSKARSKDRIDGVVALVLAISRAMLREKKSVYRERGVSGDLINWLKRMLKPTEQRNYDHGKH